MKVLKYSWLGSCLCALCIGVSTLSCSKKTTDSLTPTDASSFDLIQQRIFTPSCALSGCHASAQDASFAQHGLVLTADVAYQNLAGVSPKNTNALNDGLKRVKAFASSQSLLYYKLNSAAIHHSGQQYGNPMPLGGQSLTDGQIEFVRRWIEAGAPKTGSVVDATLLDDKTVTTTPYVSLSVPASGTGYQMAVPLFDIQPNFEREIFIRRMVGNTTDIYVSRYETKMRNGSHHFVAYDFQNKNTLPSLNDVRDLRNPDNSLNILTALSMSNHVYLAGSQAQYQDYVFPEGAALLIPAGASLDLNSHFVNKTTSVMQGEAQINLYTVDKTTVKNVVQTLNLSNTNLAIPAGKTVTLTKSFTFDKPRRVLTLTSHMHQLGVKFVIKIKGGTRDGEIVYTSTDWQHPDIVTYTTPIDLKKGEGLTSEITYTNTTTKDVSFGLTSEDEMGIIFGYYYEN